MPFALKFPSKCVGYAPYAAYAPRSNTTDLGRLKLGFEVDLNL